MAARTVSSSSVKDKQPPKGRISKGNVGSNRRVKTRKTTAKPLAKTASKTTAATAKKMMPCNGKLQAYVADCMQQYFSTLNGHQPNNLFDMVMDEIEAPLLSAALDYCEGNQSRTAEILGLNRGTLRKKLRAHNLSA